MSGKKNILITGGTGYIGSELVKTLMNSSDFNIFLIVRDLKKSKEIFHEKINYINFEPQCFKKDVENCNPDIVVHLAAYSTSSDSLEDVHKLIDSNITFTAIILDALSGCNVKLFINTGSFSEYYYNDYQISPTYFYSATKTSARYIIEYYSKKNDFKLVNAILYTVYGKKGRTKKIIDYAIDSLDSEIPVKMSEGNQILDFIHLDDVITFYMEVICNFKKNDLTIENFMVGTGKGHSIRDLVKILEDVTGWKANIQWGAITTRKIDTIKAIADNSKKIKGFSWSPKIDIISGLENYVNDLLAADIG